MSLNSDNTSEKAIVLSSGGLDSTTCLGIAIEKFGKENVSTASVIYGQKHSKELACAIAVASYYGVRNFRLNLKDLYMYSNCSLLESSNQDIPDDSYANQIEQNGTGKVSTYVPFRNGLMLSSIAVLAQSIYPDDIVHIYIGAHSDDAAGDAYADCSIEFIDAMSEAIKIGTYNQVILEAPLVNLNKAQVVEWGLKLHVPYELTYSCYHGRDKSCGIHCATCIDRVAAFKHNSIIDPIEYEVSLDWTGCKPYKEA